MSERHIELVACLHNNQAGEALIYVRVGNKFHRLRKAKNNPGLEHVSFLSRQQSIEDARNITRYAPAYEFYDSIRNAPLTQLQLERMILKLQAMGHLRDEKPTQQFG